MDYSILEEQIKEQHEHPEAEANSLYQAFQKVTDGRKKRGVRYGVALILTLLTLGKLAGAKSIAAVAEWASLRSDTLLPLLPGHLKRLPCPATYGNVLKKLDDEEVTRIVHGYFSRQESEKRCEGEPSRLLNQDGKERKVHVALDGKTLRGTLGHVSEDQPAVHLLTLYEVATGSVVAQRQVGTKHNEISAVQQWVTPDLVKDRILTADAMHTQRRFCADVVRFGGHYLLIVKKNHPQMYEDLRLFFTDPEADKEDWESTFTWNKGHGRLEWRQITTSTQLNTFFEPDWTSIGQVFQLRRRVTKPLLCTQETVYGITSLTPAQATPQQLLAFSRGHWAIENRLHYRRDVTLGEDQCQVRTGHAPHVLAALNNAVLALADALHAPNLASLLRRFDARPQEALTLLLTHL